MRIALQSALPLSESVRSLLYQTQSVESRSLIATALVSVLAGCDRFQQE